MAVKLEDILARRIRALFLDVNEAMVMARPVAEIMAKELGHDKEWIEKEIEEIKILAEKYVI
jgi:glycerol-3-phosphate dehydrogenase